jgi:hypothetical protein
MASQVEAEHGRDSILGLADELELRGLAADSESSSKDLGLAGSSSGMLRSSRKDWSCLQDEHFCAGVEDELLGKGHRERVLLFLAGTREKQRISGSRC